MGLYNPFNSSLVTDELIVSSDTSDDIIIPKNLKQSVWKSTPFSPTRKTSLKRSESYRYSKHTRNHHRHKTNDSVYSLPSRIRSINKKKNNYSKDSLKHNNYHSVIDESKISISFNESGNYSLFPRIDVETLHDIIAHQIYKPHYQSYKIIDGRFSYEYEGGHIKGALNISAQDELEEILINNFQANTNDDSGPILLIFHCEFSSHRGPTLASFLRNCDRIINQDDYPNLHYPDILILDGGYKKFYDNYPQLCEPQDYITMNSTENLLECEFEMDKFRDNHKKLSRNNSQKRFNSMTSPFLKLEPPPKLLFLERTNSNLTFSSDDNVSSVTTNSTYMSKSLLIDDLNSNIYSSSDIEVNDNDDDEDEDDNDEMNSTTISLKPSQKLKFCIE